MTTVVENLAFAVFSSLKPFLVLVFLTQNKHYITELWRCVGFPTHVLIPSIIFANRIMLTVSDEGWYE